MEQRRTRRSHRVARTLLTVGLGLVVVALAWKLGSLAADPSAEADAPTMTQSVPEFATGSTAGALTAEFPTALVPQLADAEVLSSSADPTGDGTALEVSLSLRTTSSARSALSACAKTLAAHGFTKTSGKLSGADAGATFRRTSSKAAAEDVGETVLTDFVVVAVVDDGDDRLVTLSGQVPAPKQSAVTTSPTGTSTGTGAPGGSPTGSPTSTGTATRAR